jgi:hypothetical protein
MILHAAYYNRSADGDIHIPVSTTYRTLYPYTIIYTNNTAHLQSTHDIIQQCDYLLVAPQQIPHHINNPTYITVCYNVEIIQVTPYAGIAGSVIFNSGKSFDISYGYNLKRFYLRFAKKLEIQ